MDNITIIAIAGVVGVILNQMLEAFKKDDHEHKQLVKATSALKAELAQLNDRITQQGRYFTEVDNKRFNKMRQIYDLLNFLEQKMEAKQTTPEEERDVIGKVKPNLKELDAIVDSFKNLPDKLKM